MPRSVKARREKAPSAEELIEAAIHKASSIGDLESLAGIEQDLAARTEFWLAFCRLPGGASLDAGIAELKRRIRAQGLPHPI